MPLFAASISMRKLPGLDMVIGRLFRNCQLQPSLIRQWPQIPCRKAFHVHISAVLCCFFFLLGTLQKASTASFTLSWGGNLIFTSSPALHVFHAVKQIRNNRISSADCEAFFYFTISVYRFDSDFHLPSIPLRPLPFHQEAVWPLHSLLQASQKYLRTLRKHGLSDIPILLPFDLLFSHFLILSPSFIAAFLSPF